MSKSILITGGTGSLAQAFVRRNILNYDRMVIYSRCEHKQETMREKFYSLDKNKVLRYFIGDVRDKERMSMAMRGCKYVLHTAALKIVPKLELDPIEAVKTNVYGTQNVIECALNSRTPMYVLNVSTDKAVDPLNLYGATKLCAEKLISAANNIDPLVRLATVRWGNVAMSRSSVIPLFLEQHKQGEMLTITDPNMTRFWITLREASEYIDFVFDDMENTVGQKLYIPNMPAYSIVDVAMAIDSKLTKENLRQRVKIIGPRAGEKTHESICTLYEHLETATGSTIDCISSKDAARMSVKRLKQKIKEEVQWQKAI